MNLLDMVKSYLSDETIGRIADAAGIDHGAAKGAVAAAVPTLLAGVAQTANAGQDGARRVAAAVDGVDESTLAGGGPMPSAAQGGTSTISRLLGGGATNGIVEAISRYTGIGNGAAGKVIGMVAPFVLGAIKRQKTSMGLDAGGLANLLSSQKASFMSAIPSGLPGMLSGLPGLSGLAGTAGTAAASTRQYATSAAGGVEDAEDRAAEGLRRHAPERPSYAWAVPAAIVALLAIGLWWWAGHRAETEQPRATVAPPPAPMAVTPADETATPAGAQIAPAATAADTATALSSRVSNIFSSATETFGQVHDAASAQAAAPKVDAINNQLDVLAQSAKTMPTGTREALSTTIRQWRDKLQPVTDKALATPGVGGELRPKVDDMYRKMDALMMAQ